MDESQVLDLVERGSAIAKIDYEAAIEILSSAHYAREDAEKAYQHVSAQAHRLLQRRAALAAEMEAVVNAALDRYETADSFGHGDDYAQRVGTLSTELHVIDRAAARLAAFRLPDAARAVLCGFVEEARASVEAEVKRLDHHVLVKLDLLAPLVALDGDVEISTGSAQKAMEALIDNARSTLTDTQKALDSHDVDTAQKRAAYSEKYEGVKRA